MDECSVMHLPSNIESFQLNLYQYTDQHNNIPLYLIKPTTNLSQRRDGTFPEKQCALSPKQKWMFQISLKSLWQISLNNWWRWLFLWHYSSISLFITSKIFWVHRNVIFLIEIKLNFFPPIQLCIFHIFRDVVSQNSSTSFMIKSKYKSTTLKKPVSFFEVQGLCLAFPHRRALNKGC